MIHVNQHQGLQCVLVDTHNQSVFLNLAQAYEAELSVATRKEPDERGIFSLDAMPVDPYIGYLFYQHKTPIGFCVLNLQSEPQDVSEFYIIPSAREKAFGTHFAMHIFRQHPGPWQVQQIEGTECTISFWRKVIGQYTQHQYQERVMEDPDWGHVTCQSFVSKGETSVCQEI